MGKQTLGTACCYSANWLEATGEVFPKKKRNQLTATWDPYAIFSTPNLCKNSSSVHFSQNPKLPFSFQCSFDFSSNVQEMLSIVLSLNAKQTPLSELYLSFISLSHIFFHFHRERKWVKTSSFTHFLNLAYRTLLRGRHNVEDIC